MSIYPNPANNILNVSLISEIETVNIKGYNSLGRIIDEFDGMITQIDLSNYPKGLYYVGANNGEQNILKKFIRN